MILCEGAQSLVGLVGREYVMARKPGKRSNHSLLFPTNLHEAGLLTLKLMLTLTGTHPDPKHDGIDLPVGYAVSIAVTGRETSRLSAPYSQCTDVNKEASKLFKLVATRDVNFTYHGTFKDAGYSIKTCYSTCLQR